MTKSGAYAGGWLLQAAREHKSQSQSGPKTTAELSAAQKAAWERMSGKVFTQPSGYAAKTLESELAKRQATQVVKVDRCPRCANQVLAQVGDFQSCVCGWNSKQPQDEPRGFGQFVMAKLGLG